MRAFLLLPLSIAFAADPASIEKGRAEERASCGGCHSLRISSTQRLTRGGWEKELDKMVRWGAQIKDREALLDYLVDRYGEDKPPQPLPRSANASSMAER